MASVKKLLADALGNFVFKPLHVDDVQTLSPSFRQLTLSGTSLRGGSFTPGDKVQVMIDDGPRAYTPFSVDPVRGTMSLLVYIHGDSPGSRWGRQVATGQTIRVFGPRGSLSSQGRTVVVGDETSFALAHALSATRSVFEVTNEDESRAVVGSLGLDAALIVRRGVEDHLGALEDAVRSALDPQTTLVLTGRAHAIQALRTRLKARPTAYATQKTKAYWAPGKRALD